MRRNDGAKRGAGHVLDRRAFLKKGAGFAAGMAAANLAGSLGSVLLQPGRGNTAEAGGHFVQAARTEISSLDPHEAYTIEVYSFTLNMYDNLIRFERNPPEAVPWLAESYSVSGDGLTWTFRLRRGVKFHDGRELTAEDVVYSVDRLLRLGKDPASVFKPCLKPGASEALDRYTVRMKLYQPFAPFLSILPIICVVNKDLVQKNEKGGDLGAPWLSRNDAGSGGFKLRSYEPAKGFVMDRFGEYWRGWKGNHVQSAEVRIIREPASQVLNLQKGTIHMTHTLLPPEQFERMETMKGVKVTKDQTLRTFVIRIHNQRSPVNDVNVRKAIAHAFDYDGFNKGVMKGNVVRNPVPIPLNMWGNPKNPPAYTFDLGKAESYLSKAKSKISRPLDLISLAGNPITDQAALLLQSNLKKLGVEVKIRGLTFPQFSVAAKNQETMGDLAVHWVSSYYPDPDNWIGKMYDSRNWGAWQACSFYKNPEVDNLLQKAREVVERAERQKLYERATAVVFEDSVDVWIYNSTSQRGLSDRLQGYNFCPVGDGLDFYPLYFTGA